MPTISDTESCTSFGGFLIIKISELSTNSMTNTSQVQVTGTAYNDSAQATTNSHSNVTVFINGDQVYDGASQDFNMAAGARKQIIQHTFTVAHADDGTGSCSFTVNFDNTFTEIFGGPCSASATLDLSGIAQAADAPGTPSFTNILPTSVTVSWDAPDSDGGGTISFYLVERYLGDDTTDPAPIEQSVNGLTYNDTGLLPGQDYTYTVTAYNGAGTTGYSTPSDSATVSMPAAGWVRVDGVWTVANPYVRVDGEWKMCLPYIRVNGLWTPTY